ncbi:MAG: SPOR domain-containing protein [Ignavibacteria bacterium]|nr:SPOR domain-containing protein [Ignavibacteria bacterium]
MIIRNLRSISFLALFFFLATVLYSQEVDITSALKSIEVGKTDAAQAELQKLKDDNSSNPSVIFLDAVLTRNADESIKKYSTVFEKYPKSKYADVSLYRVFSYYYSLGYYKKAESYFKRLKIDYPASPYIAAADRNIPDTEETVTLLVSTANSTDTTNKNSSIQPQKEKAKFTIQAGAFLSVENANRLKELLSKDGFPSEIINKVVGGSLLKVVTTGHFISEADAKSSLSQIEVKYNLKGRVIPLPTKP